MRLLRACIWVGLAAGLVCVAEPTGALARSKRLSKLIVYPAEGETAAQLRARGAAKVDEYGSYWIVHAEEARVGPLQQALKGRAFKAKHLDRIELLAAQFDTAEGEPAVPQHLRQKELPGPRLWLVQFVGPVLPEWLEMLEGAGKVKIVSYVPNNAYIVRMDKAAEEKLAALAAPNGPIQWIGAYHPYYKIQPGLLPKKAGQDNALIDVRVAVLDGPDADAALEEVWRFAFGGGGEPLVQLGQKIVQFTARVSDIPRIAEIPQVLWIERVVRKELKDEKQGLILASRTNQLPGHSPIPPALGGERYLDFLFDKVAGGLTNLFTTPSTYPIVDIADTGLETGTTRPVHPAFYEFGDRTRDSRVVYNTRAGYPNGLGCPPWTFEDIQRFNDGSDFCDHGTLVASIVAGYDSGDDETFLCTDTRHAPFCEVIIPPEGSPRFICRVITVTDTNILTLVRKDTQGFQRGMGVSPFGLIGSTRIFSQDLEFECNPYSLEIRCVFCATSLPVLLAQEYLSRARIVNNSWGDILVATPEGEIVNAGLYTTDSQTYDIGVRDALLTGAFDDPPGPSPLNQEMIVVFAGGNAGSVGNVGGFGDILVTAPATAKNIIAVGATENFREVGDGCFAPVEQDNTLEVSGFSAFGPTLDGRFKPDIVAPGTAIFGANNFLAFDQIIRRCECGEEGITVECHPQQGVQNCIDLYTCTAGTSFSAPAVSGGIQLLWWYFQNRLGMLQPSPAMAKAYLLNSARYLPIRNPITGTFDTLPSIAQGMGMMDLERMFDGVPRALRDQTAPRAIDVTLLLTNPVPQQTYFSRSGQSYELSGQIFDATKPFRVTVAWTDVPGSPAANGSLVNDLDLEVTVAGRTYRGNIFNRGDSVIDVTRGIDNINNVESVFLPPGSTGTWTVVVRATNIAGDGVPNVGNATDQDFALVVYNTTTPSDVPNPATNDTCQTAILVTEFPFTTTLNLTPTVFHNNHPSPSAARGGIEAFWTLGRPTQGTVFSIDTFGSNFDTVLSVWRGSCGALVEVASNNNAAGTLQSSVTFTANGLDTYYVVVDRRAGPGTSLVLNIRAVPPPIRLQPSTLDFGNVFVGSSSAPQTTIYTNGSPQSAFIDNVRIEGDDAAAFTIIDETCDATIQAGGTCSITVSFSPTHVGTHTATLVVTDNHTGSPRIAFLTGNGLAPSPLVCLGAGSLNFGSVGIGLTGTVHSVTVTNCGVADLFITNAVLSGSASNEFLIVSDTCSGQTVPVDGTCSVGLRFAPAGSGPRNASLLLHNNAPGSPHSVSLAGTGVTPTPAVCLSASALSFGHVSEGTTSAPQSIVITNCGTGLLSINSITLTGANAGDFTITSDPCTGSTLPVGGTCTVTVTFTPSAIGLRTATLLVGSNAAGSPHAVALSGLGAGSQPDASASRSRSVRKFVGRGLITPTDPIELQTVERRVKRGGSRTFFVRIRNSGTGPDAFRVLGSSDSPGNFSVRYFLGAFPREGIEVSGASKAGTLRTSTLAEGAETGDATLVRVEITVDPSAPAGAHDVLVTTTSVADPTKSDTVRLRVSVR